MRLAVVGTWRPSPNRWTLYMCPRKYQLTLKRCLYEQKHCACILQGDLYLSMSSYYKWITEWIFNSVALFLLFYLVICVDCPLSLLQDLVREHCLPFPMPPPNLWWTTLPGGLLLLPMAKPTGENGVKCLFLDCTMCWSMITLNKN